MANRREPTRQHRSLPSSERSRRGGLLLAVALVVVGLLVQLALMRWTGGSLVTGSLALLALVPLVGAGAAVFWLVRRVRSGR